MENDPDSCDAVSMEELYGDGCRQQREAPEAGDALSSLAQFQSDCEDLLSFEVLSVEAGQQSLQEFCMVPETPAGDPGSRMVPETPARDPGRGMVPETPAGDPGSRTALPTPVLGAPHQGLGDVKSLGLEEKNMAERTSNKDLSSKSESNQPQRTVEVRGFDPAESELYELYFSNPQKEGGPIKDLRLGDDKTVMYITFESPEVATNIASKEHTIKNRTLRVAVYKPVARAESNQLQCTVEVRGFDPAETELYELYFSSPQKGGGPIKNLRLSDDKTVMYITFESPEVATNIASKEHTIKNRTLRVAVYKPVARAESNQLQCTVEVRGFDPAETEFYELYFSSLQKGGGPIKNLRLSDDKTVMYITFESPEVATNIASKEHTIKNRTLRVAVYKPVARAESNQLQCTVEVRGFDPAETELYELYFSSLQKGGRPIKNLRLSDDKTVMYITFESPEVVHRVVSMKHTAGGKTLKLSSYSAKETSPAQPKSRKIPEKEDRVLCTVMVTVEGVLQNADFYKYYFSNPSYGGGNITDVKLDGDEGVAYITFADPAVAERVSRRQHDIGAVTVQEPPQPWPTYPNKLLLRNVADGTSEDCLSMYLEEATGLALTGLLYGDETGTVLITFQAQPDLKRTESFCQKNPLEKRQLRVETVPVTNCLLVEGLSPQTTEDTVKYYFQNRRSKGGPVESIQMLNGNKCLVYFEKYEVVDQVLTKEHRLDSAKLVLKKFIASLGVSGGQDRPRAFAAPDPVVFDNLDCYKVAFLHQNQLALSGLVQQLSDFHAIPKLDQNRLIVECTLSKDVENARVLARTWSEGVRKAVEGYTGLFVVLECQVKEEVWESVVKAVNSAGLDDKAGAVCFQEQRKFVVVGVKSMAQQLFDNLTNIVTAQQDELERMSQRVSETCKKLHFYQLRLLLARAFQVEAGKRYKDFKIDINVKKQEIVFHGMMQDVRDCHIKMFETLQGVKSNTIADMNDLKNKLLSKTEAKQYVVQKLKKDKVTSVWELGERNEITVFAFGDRNLADAVRVIRKSLTQWECKLSPESSRLLTSREWQDFVKELTAKHPGLVLLTPSHNHRSVFVTAVDSVMPQVSEETKCFLENNSIYSQMVRFSPSRQKFVEDCWQGKLLSLQESFKAYRVQMDLKQAGTEIYIKGTRLGLQKVGRKLEEWNRLIKCHTETFRDPSKVKLLQSSEIYRDLNSLSKSCKCVLTLQPEADGLEVKDLDSFGNEREVVESSGNRETCTRLDLPNGGSLFVVPGDITELSVDVIVNAANSEMKHMGGLAKHIVNKGGQSIQQECFQKLDKLGRQLAEGEVLTSGSGKLRCKMIIHAVGPVYNDGCHGEEDRLRNTVMNCMLAAAETNLTSIAFPAISTGIFRYPTQEATLVIAQAVRKHFEDYRRSSIDCVYLCHQSQGVVQSFSSAAQQAFPPAPPVAEPPRMLDSPLSQTQVKGATAAPAVKRRARGGSSAQINVSIISGEIAKQKVDVIVNSVAKDGNLSQGAVSSSILKEAGPQLQQECTQNTPNGISVGEIARTRGYNLHCTEVFHLALCQWSNPGTAVLKLLGDTVIRCLVEASKQSYSSMAFPVLGTGNLGYPAHAVASTMLQAVDNFRQNTPASSLKDVRIIVYHTDTAILQAFQAVQAGILGLNPDLPRNSRQSRTLSSTIASEKNTASGSGNFTEFQIGNVKLLIKQGDITEQTVDAIVNSTNSELDLTRGIVSKILRDKCGPSLERECALRVADMKKRNIVVTKAYQMKCKSIVHINSERLSDDWTEAVKLCLKECQRSGFKSVAMPALGTGMYGETPQSSATAFFRAIDKFMSSDVGSLQQVIIVLYDFNMIQPFASTIEQCIDKQKQQKPGVGQWIISALKSSGSKKQHLEGPVQCAATLYIYTDSPPQVHAVLKGLDDLIKDRFIQKRIDYAVVYSLKLAEKDEIENLLREESVEIKVYQDKGYVQINGLHMEVIDAMQKVNTVLRKIERAQQHSQSASMLSKYVQWSYLEVKLTGTEAYDYGELENHMIEMAYQSEKKTAEMKFDGGNVYVIDFQSMEEFPQSDPSDRVSVIRRDKVKGMASSGSLPVNWTKHADKENVKVVPLQATAPEYKSVEALFRSSLGGGQVQITSIERVQNRTLYQQYATKQTSLENQNPGVQNEKTLWHGTASNAVDNINHHGFNRSYCGKNATAYGEGVYFAVNSSYSTSTTYSPPDPAGVRRIYQCKVLVGHPTVGKHQLRVLPTRQGSYLYDSATDNVNSPSMYVIFNDTQAYPEYIISFK